MTTIRLLLGTAVFMMAQMAFAQQFVPMDGRLVPGSWESQWTSSMTSNLTASGLLKHDEKQIDALCAGYSTTPAKRVLFWNQLMISLSLKESSFDPAAYIYFNGGINEGLFQIDPRLNGYYGCGSSSLFNAASNISCAIKMAARLTAKWGSFLSGSVGGMAAYWQPLRSTSSMNLNNRRYILSSTTAACKQGRLVIPSRPMVMEGIQSLEITPNTLEDLSLL